MIRLFMDDKLYTEALLAAQAACKAVKDLTLEGSETILQASRKTDVADVFTEIDIQVQNKIADILLKEFPTFGFLGEEESTASKISDVSGYSWIVDPIDGTENYSNHLPCYGTSIALLKNGSPVVGVVSLPALNVVYAAVAGKGSTKNEQQIHTRSCNKVSDAIFGEFFSDRIHRGTQVLYPPAAAYRRFGSAVCSMMFLAEGSMDAVLLRCHLWDIAAASLIVQEAGGKVLLQKDNPSDLRSSLYCIASVPGIFNDVQLLVHSSYYPDIRPLV